METAIAKYLPPVTISNSKYYVILFILWPFLTFIISLINYKQTGARRIVYLFLIYFGLTYFIPTDYYIDASTYAMRLKLAAELPSSDFFKYISGFHSDTSLDFIDPLITFLISRITNHHGVYFAVWAAIFGYFYLKSINLLYSRIQSFTGLNTIIFLTFFIFILPITSLSTVRMWTAAWIFFYGAYHVILFKKANYIIVALTASLVHWSFISVNAILILYYFVGNRNSIYFPIAILSFFIPQIISPLLQTLSIRLGGGIQNRFESYSEEAYILQMQASYEQAKWFMSLSGVLIFYYVIFVIIIIWMFYRDRMSEQSEKNLFSFLLLFLSFLNFASVIPSFGGRFLTIFLLFGTLYILMYFINLQSKQVSLLTWIGIMPMALFAALRFRQGAETINAWIFSPGFGLPLIFPGLSFTELLP